MLNPLSLIPDSAPDSVTTRCATATLANWIAANATQTNRHCFCTRTPYLELPGFELLRGKTSDGLT
jgi:hypothetical protein